MSQGNRFVINNSKNYRIDDFIGQTKHTHLYQQVYSINNVNIYRNPVTISEQEKY